MALSTPISTLPPHPQPCLEASLAHSNCSSLAYAQKIQKKTFIKYLSPPELGVPLAPFF